MPARNWSRTSWERRSHDADLGGGSASNILETKFVVHTHALLVNGMTCAKDGEAVSRRLFLDALWVEYIDAGYTLCMELKEGSTGTRLNSAGSQDHHAQESRHFRLGRQR